MHIVMLEPLGLGREQLEEAAAPLLERGHTLLPCTQMRSPEEQRHLAAGADALVIAHSPLPSGVLEAAQDVKILSVGFTGVDHVDMSMCRARGITVCNAAGYCTDAVAELTLGLIFALLRRIPACDARTREGGDRTGLMGFELKGKTIGLVGTGAIAQRVSEIARVLGCRVLGYSRRETEQAKAAGIEFAALDLLFSQSDIVSLHCPLNEESRGLVDARRIGLMKPTALLINTARGAVVDSAALADALNAGRIAGAGLDVFETEPPLPAEHSLRTAKNALLAPHVAFCTAESMERRARIVFLNILAYLDGAPTNVCR